MKPPRRKPRVRKAKNVKNQNSQFSSSISKLSDNSKIKDVKSGNKLKGNGPGPENDS